MASPPQRIYTIVVSSLLAVAAILTYPNAAAAQQTAPASPLPAPELTAQAADGAVELSWTEVTGAARYELWSWNSAADWEQIGGDDLTGASYSHTGLAASATYYYQVRAVNAADENGEWSQRISATLPADIDAPALTAQAAAGAVELSWTEVAGAVRYELWSWNSPADWVQIGGDDLTAASFTHTGLTVGTTYFYQIRAVNAADGKGQWSPQASATVVEAQSSTSTPTATPTPTPTPDAMPTATPTPTPTPDAMPTATPTPTPTPDAMPTATPTPTPTPDAMPTATPTPTPTPDTMPTATPTPTPTPDTMPTATPTPTPTATPTSTLTAQTLSAPSLTAQAAAGAAELRWDPVDGAVRYELWYWTSEDGWQQIGGDNLTATSYTHTGLEAGTTYHYAVRAVNAADEVSAWSEFVPVTVTAPQSSTATPTPTPTLTPTSDPSTLSTATPTPTSDPSTLSTATPTPTSTPAPLSVPALTAKPNESTVELTWDPVAGAVQYVLWTWTSYGGLQRLDDGDLTATTYTHQGLEAGTTYHYSVRAVNSAGDVSPWSPWIPTTLPGPQTLLPSQIFEKASPAIAYIEAGVDSGSGMLVEGGYVVTAAHVVWPFDAVRVVFPDGTAFEQVPVNKLDLIADLAILGPVDVPIEPATMIDGENIPIGSRVYLIGYPGEYELFPQPTITGGILSRLRQWEPGAITFIQTDSTIAGGQSGGALVSDTGAVIGMSNFKVFGEFGLVVSAGDLLPRIQQLIAGQDPGGHGERRLPQTGGALRHNLTLDNYWDDQAYVIYERRGTEMRFSLLGNNNGALAVYDAYGITGETFDNFDITGFEYGAYILGRLTPHYLIVRQKAATPGDFIVAANHAIFPVDDPDGGQMIKVGQSLNGNIDFPSDADHFFLDLEQGQTVEILAQSILADMFLTLSLGTPGQSVSRDDGSGLLLRDSRLLFQAPITARYILIVETFEPEAPGGYILTVNPFSME